MMSKPHRATDTIEIVKACEIDGKDGDNKEIQLIQNI